MSNHVFDLTQQKWTQVYIPFEYRVFSQKTGEVIEKGDEYLMKNSIKARLIL